MEKLKISTRPHAEVQTCMGCRREAIGVRRGTIDDGFFPIFSVDSIEYFQNAEKRLREANGFVDGPYFCAKCAGELKEPAEPRACKFCKTTPNFTRIEKRSTTRFVAVCACGTKSNGSGFMTLNACRQQWNERLYAKPLKRKVKK
jgi:hypothetical protein